MRMNVVVAGVVVAMSGVVFGQTGPATGPGGGRVGGRMGRPPAIGVTADHGDWKYVPGEKVKFVITAKAGTAVTYTVGPEMMPAESKSGTVPEGGTLEVDGGTMAGPGFLRCVVTAPGYGRNLATAAFSPEKVQPTQQEPADFDAFWAKAKEELAAVPMDAKLTPMPQNNTEKADAFEVNLQNIGTAPEKVSRFYGILYVPHGEGPFPAMMSPPGAGVRGPDTDIWKWTDRGFMVLYVGIHEMPVVPEEFRAQGSKNVSGNYASVGLEDPAHYYFRRVLMGCVRADDYLVAHPKWDHKNLVMYGGSQGGYLSITTAALDPRVTALCPSYPAYCDETGYLHGRPSGWPGFKFNDMSDPQREAKIATTAYFDTVNFARRLKVPGHYAWGYNDETCPPDSVFSAYNVITAPKELTVIKEMGHGRVPALTDIEHEWVMKQLKK
jgi:cephalosporin-C deacetylase-like acetyl esterase